MAFGRAYDGNGGLWIMEARELDACGTWLFGYHADSTIMTLQ